ncbi:MAG: UDP-glucose 4-epimerase GalE [Spirochaetales bacterium]|nr:UDP-glucose 4-epimerase GalE [Spirochaetales bacterium]
MHVLVAGGAGYIGSHVALELQNAGHEVSVFDNLSTGMRSNLQKGMRLYVGDLNDRRRLEKAFVRRPDAVIHLAAAKAVGESMENPEKYSRNNLMGTLSLLEAMTNAGCSQLVFSSTAAVYGEPRYTPVDEAHALDPQSYYGFTKLEIERILAWYDRLKGIKYAVLRYFNAAGYDPEGRILGKERNPQNLLPRVLEVAAGLSPQVSVFGNDFPTQDGSGVRDYVHVTDLARAHLLSLEKIASTRQSLTVNLGSETGISVLEILEAARRVTGRAIPAQITGRRAGDPAVVVADAALAKKTLGWIPRYSDPETLLSTAWKVYKPN